jgi:hypothetical protein
MWQSQKRVPELWPQHYFQHGYVDTNYC